MSLATVVAEAITAVNGLVTTVKGQFSKWDGQVNGKINKLEEWRSGAKNEYPVFNILKNPNFDLDVNNPFLGYSLWESNISITGKVKLFNASGWWREKENLLELTIVGEDTTTYKYGSLLSQSQCSYNKNNILATRAFDYRIIFSNSQTNKATVGWESGSRPLDMNIDGQWKSIELTTTGTQFFALMGFVLGQNAKLVIEVKNLRLNLGASSVFSLPLRYLTF